MPLIVDGTTGVTFNDASLQGAAASPFGLKNRIINGDMVIDQRNAGASVTQIAGVVYGVDRWYTFGTVTSKFTAQRNAGSVTPPDGFTNYWGITSSSAYTPGTSEQYIIVQAVEGFNVADLGWGTANAKTVTLSFWVRSSLTGTFSGGLQNNDASRSYSFTYSIPVANTWTKISVTIAGDTTGTWLTNSAVGVYVNFSMGTGSAFQSTVNTWAAGNFKNVSGAVNLVATNGATFYITGVQLERNTTATPFEWIPFGTELALCQRYYWRSVQDAGAANGLGFCLGAGSNASRVQVPLPTIMRTQPSVTFSTGGNPIGLFNPAGGGGNMAIITGNYSTRNMLSLDASVSGGTLNNGVTYLVYLNGASAFMDASAEL